MVAPSMTAADASPNIGGDTVKTVFNLAALHAFRELNIHRRLAQLKWSPADGPMRGSAVTFTKIDALSTSTTPLSETADPAAKNMTDAQVTITPREFGDLVVPTKKLRLVSFLNLDLEIPREVTLSMEESADILARDVLAAGTNALFAGNATSRTTVGTDDTFIGKLASRVRAELKGNKTPAIDGSGLYLGIIHPDVSYDMMVDTGAGGWREPHVNIDPAAVYQGEVGSFGGVRFVENANAKLFADASNGAGATGLIDVYATIVVGFQALGEAVVEPQHVVVSGPFDALQRFVNVGWYGFLDYGRVREESLFRIESSSSIGANT